MLGIAHGAGFMHLFERETNIGCGSFKILFGNFEIPRTTLFRYLTPLPRRVTASSREPQGRRPPDGGRRCEPPVRSLTSSRCRRKRSASTSADALASADEAIE